MTSETKRMDVQMSEVTMQQQRDISSVDDVKISRTRERVLAEGIAKLHKKLFKPGDISKSMGPIGDDSNNA